MQHVTLIAFLVTLAATAPAAEVVEFFGYDDCIRLHNATTQVTLCPAAGGRVLEYAVDGKNALYIDHEEAGWTYKPGQGGSTMSAGRFDIGPEQIIPQRPTLWFGRWQGQITGERSARMTSLADDATGTQLVRDFELAATGTQLICRQTIRNISDHPTEWCHWSRTFALGNGICVIPLSTESRFPNHYVMYESSRTMNFRPADPHIYQQGEYLVIDGVPQHPKLGMDSKIGWFAYLMPNDLMFVKQYPTFPERVYNEVAGLTISIWYPRSKTVELEPIGPAERLQPGESASFTETWTLKPYPFPESRKQIDAKHVAKVAVE